MSDEKCMWRDKPCLCGGDKPCVNLAAECGEQIDEVTALRARVAELEKIERAAVEWRDGWRKTPGDRVAALILSGLGPDGKEV